MLPDWWNGKDRPYIIGDCLDVMGGIPDDSVRLVIADPPYNVGIDYGTSTDDKRDKAEYMKWCAEWFKHCRRIAERVIITPGVDAEIWHEWFHIERPWAIGMWYKPGNFGKSILGGQDYEPWFYWCKDYKALGGCSTVKATVGTQKDAEGHPCPKPVELFAKLISKASRKGDIVFDPFLGSGTTLLACRKTDRLGLGCEINPAYEPVIARRILDGVGFIEEYK